MIKRKGATVYSVAPNFAQSNMRTICAYYNMMFCASNTVGVLHFVLHFCSEICYTAQICLYRVSIFVTLKRRRYAIFGLISRFLEDGGGGN